MKNTPLCKISVSTSIEAEDAVAHLFQTLFGQPASSYVDADTRATTVSIFLPQSQDHRAIRTALSAGLKRISQCGLDPAPAKISLRKVRQLDWAESWKRHFKPITVGAKLLIKPSWSRRAARPGQSVVILDPGLSFGTGQHPTTDFCLQQLCAHRHPATLQSFLDIGTGSGILAIAAAKLGFTPVEAFDFDPESVRVAQENAQRNDVLDKIKLHQADLTRLPRRSAQKHDLLCANLISNLLLAERERILARLKPGGVLVVAGILKTEFAGVRTAFEKAGLRLLADRAENEWQSGSFRS